MTRKRKIVIFTGYKCNNNCLFCVNADKRNLSEKTTSEIATEIYRAKNLGADVVEIIGGESTIRGDFFHLVRVAKKIGIPEVLAATNGRVFSRMETARLAVKSGIDGIIFSLHGHNPRTHDGLTRSPGSFSELIKGMGNLRKLGFFKINGNTTVVRQNMRHLMKIGSVYRKYGVKNVEFIFVDPTYGGAKKRFGELVPMISECAPRMRRVLDEGESAGYGQWKARYVPLCHFKNHLAHISDINERMLFSTVHWAPDFENRDVAASRQTVSRVKTERCRGCRLFNACEGIWKEYIAHYGDGELKAVK